MKRKSVIFGSIAGLIAFIILMPIDELIIATLVSHFFFKLGWLESVLIGIIIGAVSIGIIEVVMGED